MNRIFAATLSFLLLASTAAWGQEAMDFYNRGLQSSLAYRKIEYFTKALQLNPKLAEAYEKRAIHYYFQRRFDRAIQDYSRFIDLEPHRPNAYVMRGLAYLKKGHPEGLMAEISRLAAYFSKPERPRSGALLDSAINDFSCAIELDSRLASAYSYRAEAYRIKGMINEAIHDSTMAIQLHEDQKTTARAYATRAETYRKLGQRELSEADFYKSVELDPYSPDYPPLHVPLLLRYSTNMASLKTVRWAGLLFIIVITLAVVCHLTLRAPNKKD